MCVNIKLSIITNCYLKCVTLETAFLESRSVIGNMFSFCSTVDDDYLQNASAILDKLKSYYRQGGDSNNLSKVLQDYTQVLHVYKCVELQLMIILTSD